MILHHCWIGGGGFGGGGGAGFQAVVMVAGMQGGGRGVSSGSSIPVQIHNAKYSRTADNRPPN